MEEIKDTHLGKALPAHIPKKFPSLIKVLTASLRIRKANTFLKTNVPSISEIVHYFKNNPESVQKISCNPKIIICAPVLCHIYCSVKLPA